MPSAEKAETQIVYNRPFCNVITNSDDHSQPFPFAYPRAKATKIDTITGVQFTLIMLPYPSGCYHSRGQLLRNLQRGSV